MYLTEWYEEKIGFKIEKNSKLNHPPMKNNEKWIDAIIKWRYSAKKNINNIGPLYSVEYPATTSDSVSEWSKGALLDSKNKTIINPDAAGKYKSIFQ